MLITKDICVISRLHDTPLFYGNILGTVEQILKPADLLHIDGQIAVQLSFREALDFIF